MIWARWTIVVCAATASCLQIAPAGDTADSGQAPPSGNTNSSADAGIGCATDSALELTLCTALTKCPGVAVDHDVYPDCGFRLSASAVDLLCVCNETWICPMGVALSCSQATNVLNEGSEAAVCAQIADGRCTDTTAPATSSTGNASCDETCRASCASDFACLSACGC